MKPYKFTFILPDMSWLYDYKAQFSLGILYLAAVLQDKGCPVSVFDTNIHLIEDIEDSDVFCFSAVYTTYSNCVDLAKKIRNKYPHRKIIIGGVSPTLEPLKMDLVFDSIFSGQAEDIICDYVEDLKEGKTKRFYSQEHPVNVDKYIPCRDIVTEDYIRTSSIFSGKLEYDEGGSTSIMFSRGCPFNCYFCSSAKLYNRKIQFRSIPSIQQEIQFIYDKYKIKQFRVQDDTFTINKKYLKELTDMLIQQKIHYRCSTRIDVVDYDTVNMLYTSGCREVGLGIEVADDGVLKKINKGITIERAKKAISIFKKFPIKVRLFFIIGLPYDSMETVRKNIEFIEEVQVDGITVGRFIPFPGSDMGDNLAKHNILSIKEKTCMNIGKHLDRKPNIIRTDMSEEKHAEIMESFFSYLVEKGYV